MNLQRKFFIILQPKNEIPLPKFGEWDVSDPASAEGFTVIFLYICFWRRM